MGSGNAEVVSIGAIRPADYSRIASERVSAARRHLGLSLEDFAGYVNQRIRQDYMPETYEAWEDDMLPPGDVTEACRAVTLGLPEVAPPRRISTPAAFPAQTLAGLWVTSYQFSHAGGPLHHADIAHVIAVSDSRIQVVNHPPEPRSEGRGQPFRNEVDAELHGRHLIGVYQNTSDTRYYGGLMLAVLPGETVMQGTYSGVASDIDVSGSFWKWVRLNTGPVPPAGFTLRDPRELHDLVMAHSQYGAPLTLADVRGDS